MDTLDPFEQKIFSFLWRNDTAIVEKEEELEKMQNCINKKGGEALSAEITASRKLSETLEYLLVAFFEWRTLKKLPDPYKVCKGFGVVAPFEDDSSERFN